MATRAEEFDTEFETLYADQRARLTRRTVSLAGDRAEDIVHDAFLTYLTRDETIVAPRAWLERVARNRALNELRRGREVPLAQDVAGDEDQAPVEREAIRGVVAEALGELDDRSRHALLLRFFEERTYEEIAEALDVRVAQAHVIVHRSLRRLGRAIVRHLAEAHGVAECSPALEEIAGLGSAANGHGKAACDRCRPVLDELAALRTLGLLPPGIAAAWMRRIGTDTVARAPWLGDIAGQIANAVVALGIAASSIVGPTVTAPAAVRDEAPLRERARVTDTRREAPGRAAQQGSTRTNTPTTKQPAEPRTLVDDGPVGVTADDKATQGEVNDGGEAPDGGVVVCKPLEPCPPPPSREP